MADEMPAGLRYSERLMWETAAASERLLLGRIARLRSGLIDEWQEVAKEAQARVAELEAALRMIAEYEPPSDAKISLEIAWRSAKSAAQDALKENRAD